MIYIKDGNILSRLFCEFKVILAHNLNIFDEKSCSDDTKSPGQEYCINKTCLMQFVLIIYLYISLFEFFFVSCVLSCWIVNGRNSFWTTIFVYCFYVRAMNHVGWVFTQKIEFLCISLYSWVGLDKING